jgi:ubiquitin carboxyl-terminal hydrolase 36/42
MQSLIKCNVCGHTSVSFESFLDLSLELSGGGSVEEALQSYTDVENFDESVGWRCEKCAKPVAAQKQLTIYNAPNVLMLTLKR